MIIKETLKKADAVRNASFNYIHAVAVTLWYDKLFMQVIIYLSFLIQA